MTFFSNLFGTKDPEAAKRKLQEKYDREKKIASSLDKAARMKLARSPATQPEILYYLSQNDTDTVVRSTVAANDATPYQANAIIVKDQSADVRMALAGRLAKLLPELGEDTQTQLYKYTVEALETLATDEVLKIRIVLSETLKKELHAPASIVNRLAVDLERQVSEPILEHCLNVSDEVLLEILSHHPASWTVEAIAKRKKVSEQVSDAVVDVRNEIAGVALLDNAQAEIDRNTLVKITEQARIFTSWQKPLAVRAFLPREIADKLSTFVDEAVRSVLINRADLDNSTSSDISQKVREGLSAADSEIFASLSVEDKVRKLIAERALTEEILIGALEAKDRAFAIAILAAFVRTTKSSMENIIGMRKPKPVIAVCHRAGLGMRTCLRVQQELAVIPPSELIYARGGTDYPLDADEIKWQLDFLGLN